MVPPSEPATIAAERGFPRWPLLQKMPRYPFSNLFSQKGLPPAARFSPYSPGFFPLLPAQPLSEANPQFSPLGSLEMYRLVAGPRELPLLKSVPRLKTLLDAPSRSNSRLFLLPPHAVILKVPPPYCFRYIHLCAASSLSRDLATT